VLRLLVLFQASVVVLLWPSMMHAIVYAPFWTPIFLCFYSFCPPQLPVVPPLLRAAVPADRPVVASAMVVLPDRVSIFCLFFSPCAGR
jgi:hypothetical protein